MKRRLLVTLILAWTLSACTHGDAVREAPRGQAMVAVADQRAADAGLAMLAKGGTATDAAIAAMAVLGLVEPQSAGVGGGGFLVAYDRASGAVDAFDGREAAPAAVTPTYFLDDTGKPLPFAQAVASGRSTGAPSLFAMLKLAHDKGGKLPWATLFEPAIKLADDGFVVSPRLNESIAGMLNRSSLKEDPAARAYLFTPDGAPLPVGFLRKNPQYAATLRAMAKDGPAALQKGQIAQAIITAVHAQPRPGLLTEADLAAVKPRQLAAVCGVYRLYKVCGMPPPSSGGVAVIDVLGLYERARPTPAGATNADDWAAFLWASRVAYADRDYYVADDTMVPVPVAQLIDPKYIDARAKLIDLSKAAPARIAPGDTSIVSGPSLVGKWGEAGAPENGTTHMSVVDAYGNAVALTASVESAFGSQRMANGFFLNNQLTDFARVPTAGGKPVANAPAAGKKPRSSMAPTLVLDRNGNFYAAIGSPGGNAIIAYVAKTLIGLIDWKLSMQAAIEQPNVIASGDTVRFERERMPDTLVQALTARGWKFGAGGGEGSGLHGIVVRPSGLEGGADPRREGVAKTLASSP